MSELEYQVRWDAHNGPSDEELHTTRALYDEALRQIAVMTKHIEQYRAEAVEAGWQRARCPRCSVQNSGRSRSVPPARPHSPDVDYQRGYADGYKAHRDLTAPRPEEVCRTQPSDVHIWETFGIIQMKCRRCDLVKPRP